MKYSKNNNKAEPNKSNKKTRGPDKKPRKKGPEHGNYIHGQGENREYDRPKYNNWLDAVYRKFNFKCFLTNKSLKEAGELQCHHLESWATNKELRYDPNNGVLLSKEAHLAFHKKYGNGKNTRAQFEKFAEEEYGITTFPWQKGNHEPSATTVNVQDTIKTVQQERLDTLKEIALKRGHFVAEGDDGTNSQTVTIYCLVHDTYQEVNVGNYKKAKLGVKCCQHEAQSTGAQHSNEMQAKRKAITEQMLVDEYDYLPQILDDNE
jgi:hypothetical protein